MSIETELRTVLGERIPDRSSEKENHIDLMVHHFCTSDEPTPTLEGTGKEFGVSRERVRQIIKKHFVPNVSLAALPSLPHLLDLVQERNFWRYEELATMAVEEGMMGDQVRLGAIFKLATELGIKNEYAIYTPDLKHPPKSVLVPETKAIVVVKPTADKARKYINRTKNRGQFGLSRFDSLKELGADPPGEFAEMRSLLLTIIENSQNTWIGEVDGVKWYSFQQPTKNRILNFSSRVFHVVDHCDVDRLAEIYENALPRGAERSPEFPSFDVISRYLRESDYFEVNGRLVKYTGEKVEPEKTERDIIGFFQRQGRGDCEYPEIASYLTKAGLPEGSVKTVYHSPFVYVAREHYQTGDYRLVFVGAEEIATPPNRFAAIYRRLVELDETDESDEVKVRKEQGILREWLFEGMDRAKCALCCKEYPVEALVAAHKKKRAECLPEERRDPNIVMPLCVFGCDFLYERRYVRIIGGEVEYGKPPPDAESIQEYLEGIVENVLEDRWQQGSEEYFTFGWS